MYTDLTKPLESLKAQGYPLDMAYAHLLGIALGVMPDDVKAIFQKYVSEV